MSVSARLVALLALMRVRRCRDASLSGGGVKETTPFTVWAGAMKPKSATDFGFEFGVPANVLELFLAMSKLTLGTVTASAFLLPAPTQLSLVEIGLLVGKAWPIVH